MTPIEKLAEIIRLLDEAYDDYFARSDGYCKSSEGHVSIDFGTYFDRAEGKPPLLVGGVDVYSYVLGPSRGHYFKTLDEALEAVREWHADELAMDFQESW